MKTLKNEDIIIEQKSFDKIASLIKESRAKIYDELEKAEIIKRVTPKLSEVEYGKELVKRLEKFLLDLDRGFAVLARDKKYQKNDVIFQCDRVFYNFRLNCCILSNFKKGTFQKEDEIQLEKNIETFDKIVNDIDNPTVALLVCWTENEIQVRYVIPNKSKEIFENEYKKYFPIKDELEEELKRDIFILNIK